MGIGSRRVMIVGLPLLAGLSVSELKSVLAHEFGHFSGGHTALGPWIYSARGAIGRALMDLEARQIVRVPFLVYGNLFLIITQAIARGQEYVADRLSGTLYGPELGQQALRRVVGLDAAFNVYYSAELVLPLENNYRPPIVAGFQHFLAQERVKADLEGFIAEVINNEEQDVFDSHPPLRARLEAFKGMESQPGMEADSSSAMELINGVGDLELQLLQQRFGSAARRFRPLDWSDSGEVVYVPYARQNAKLFEPALISNKVSYIPGIISDPAPFMYKVRAHINVCTTEEPAKVTAFRASLYALVTAMKRDDWSVVSLPGEPVTMVRGEIRVHPQDALAGFMEEQPDASKWDNFIAETGIADLPLYEESTG
jgi:heat shock protein HtpX